METLDLVVIGAGIFGLAVAKTFRQLNPSKTLAILDSGSSLGGVWGKDRLYPTLKTNNMLGTFEYPDFPMTTDAFGVRSGEHMSGEVMYRYLTRYAEHFGILGLIRYRTAVISAEHQCSAQGGWILTIRHGESQHRLFAHKLVIAAGFTSEPVLPRIQGQEQFDAPIFHSRDLVKHADTQGTANWVTVLGGTKSAWDAVYAYASKGIQVHWIIRESGHGPVWMAPPFVTPLKKWLEKLVHTRMLAWLSPCIWGGVDGYAGIRSFYHRTAIGRAVTDAFWSVLGNDILTLNKYDSHPETKKLKPWSHPMFTASSFSILNYPTRIFDLVRNGAVRVHVADVTSLSTRTVHLSDGTQLETDLLCCATGWKHVPPVRFLPEGIDRELGLPHVPSESGLFTPEAVARADEEIFSLFPRLKDQPVQNRKLKPIPDTSASTTTNTTRSSTTLTPWTLYRFMVPPSARFLQTRDIAFAGSLLNFSTFMVAHAQALWITAYFSDQLPASKTKKTKKTKTETKTKTLADLRRETLLHARFGRWRYPAGHGAQFPDFVFDGLPYLDLLVRDLGLRVRRKGGWLAEVTEPYGPEDYRELVGEFVDKLKGVEAGGGEGRGDYLFRVG
ncbi:FAD/NAD(P)-binding domain-containing protein [Parathielavia hyrcaniae]|uniref:FAD/NAD(P)-binding domain-containing protein n=1 Tax=Parathielavia hyrcaniae TaxID=113614 RepID=A0AAN6PSF0_9PEZI|nr:FAD/NAD(P)-binding domain-containing protein [Parathielavia hyrcaniae]